MSLLTLIQTVADELSITRPGSVISNSDQQVRQLLAIANREGRRLSQQYDWEVLVKEEVHTTTAAEDQGALTTIAGSDFRYIVNDTMWNRTLNRPIPGPLTATQWATLKSSSVTGPYQEFYIKGGKLLLIPVPTAGDSLTFEWVSKNWILDNDGSTTKETFTEDTDTTLLPQEIIELGVKWRWLKAKGFDYSEEFRDYQIAINIAMGRDGAKTTLRADNVRHRRPSISVPSGSWTP